MAQVLGLLKVGWPVTALTKSSYASSGPGLQDDWLLLP